MAALIASANPVTSFTLDNGLTVLVAPDHTLPRAYVEVRYRVGSANEDEGLSGFAHLFEHLMFEGSRNVPPGKFDSWLESAGGDNNAWTSNDRTVFYETVPNSALELALFLEADRMAGLLDGMPDTVVDAQRGVVRNERRQRYEVRPYGRADLVLQSALYPQGHPYHRPVIGSHEDLAAASDDDVRSFYKRFYVPGNASLMVAGDVDPDEVRELVERHFGRIPAGAVPPAPTAAPFALDQTRALVVEDRVELPRISLAWPSRAWREPGDAELDLVQEVLTEGRTGRLRQRLVDDLGLAQSVNGWQVSRELAGHFEIEVTARPGVDLDEVLQVIDAELSRLTTDGVTDDELLQARRALQMESLDSAERLSARAAKIHSWFDATGQLDGMAADRRRYAAVTAASVLATARDVFGPGRVVVSVVPEGQPALAVSGAVPVPPEPEVPMSKVRPGKRDRPKPVLRRPEVGPSPNIVFPSVARSVLPGGVDVATMRREDTGLFDVRVLMNWGADDDPEGAEGLAYRAASMANRGAGGRDAVAFEAELRRLGATLDIWTDWETTQLHLHAPVETAAAATQLLADALLEPTMSGDEWTLLEERERAALVRARTNPRALLRLSQLRAQYGTAHRRGFRLMGTSTTQAAITLNAVKATWHERVRRGRPLVIVAADLDEAGMRDALQPLAGWAPDKALRRPLRAHRLPPPQRQVWWVDRPDSVQSLLSVMGPAVATVPLQHPPTEIMSTLLGGSFASRLNHNLREVHQYAYGASCYVVRNRWLSYLAARTQVATEVTGAALAEIYHELDAIQMPPTERELTRVRAYTLLSLPDEIETGRVAVGELAWLHAEGGDFSTTQALVDAIPHVTGEAVARAARALLVGEGGMVIGVGSAADVTPQLGDRYGPVHLVSVDALLGPEPANTP